MALKLQLQESIYYFLRFFSKFVVIYFTADVRKPENSKFLWNYFPPSKQCARAIRETLGKPRGQFYSVFFLCQQTQFWNPWKLHIFATVMALLSC